MAIPEPLLRRCAGQNHPLYAHSRRGGPQASDEIARHCGAALTSFTIPNNRSISVTRSVFPSRARKQAFEQCKNISHAQPDKTDPERSVFQHSAGMESKQ